MIRDRQPERGFTLVELMISLLLFSLAVAGILSVAVAVSQGFREQRATVSAESAVRVPLDVVADMLRQVSPGVPSGNIQDAGTCSSGALTVTNSSTGSDQIDMIFGSGAFVTSTRGIYAAGTTSLVVNDASQLAIGDSILITDSQQGHLVKITGISGTTLALATQCVGISMPAGGYAAGALVIRAMHAVLSIGSVDGVPTLMMDPDAGGSAVAEPFAEGIEDLQIAVGVDVNADGALTEVGAAAGDDEWQYNKAGDGVLGGAVRAVRITIIARASNPVSGTTALFNRPAAEDRAVGTTFDLNRRRVLRTTVEMRNLGGSP